MSDLQELFSRDPLDLSKQDLKRICRIFLLPLQENSESRSSSQAQETCYRGPEAEADISAGLENRPGHSLARALPYHIP